MSPDECGSNFCHHSNVSKQHQLLGSETFSSVPTLIGILLGFSLLAPLLILFQLDHPPKDIDEIIAATEDESSSPNWRNFLVATFQQMRNTNQLLIISLTIWSGFENAFISADFTFVIKIHFHFI